MADTEGSLLPVVTPEATGRTIGVREPFLLSTSSVGYANADLNPNIEITAAETAAGITSVNVRFEAGDLRRYGLNASAAAAVNTTAIQDGLDSNVRVTAPEGTFAHNAIAVHIENIIQGQGPKTTIFEYLPTTGDGWVLDDNAGRVQFLDLKLTCVTTSTGHAIGPKSVATINREFRIDRYEIEGFLKGIFIQLGLNIFIGQGRLLGQGKAVAGGVGIKLGSRADNTSVNGAILDNVFPSGYETNIFLDQGQSAVLNAPVNETTDIGILINNFSAQLNFPYFDSDWQTVVSTTLDAAEDSGQTIISVAETDGFAISDPVFVFLINGQLHRSTIASISTGVSITIDDALPSDTADGADFVRATDLIICAMGTKALSLDSPTVFVLGSRDETEQDKLFISPQVRLRSQLKFSLGEERVTGSTIIPTDFALSAGWGTTASLSSAIGHLMRGRFTVTSAGTGQGANPTITLTFRNSQLFLNAPFMQLVRNGGDQITIGHSWTTTTTTVVITWIGTPVAAETYTFEYLLTG